MKCPDSYVQGGWARRSAPLVLCSVLLGACTMPVPLRVTSWALDGIAYLTTEKSVTDHGISLVAQQDCALWRGFMGEQICQSEDGTAIAVAAAEGQPAGNAEGGYSSDAWALAALAPAAGPTAGRKEIFIPSNKTTIKTTVSKDRHGKEITKYINNISCLPLLFLIAANP